MRSSALKSVAAATALALASPLAGAQGLQFDPTGMGLIGGSLFFPSIAWERGDVIVDNAFFDDGQATLPGGGANLPGAEIGQGIGLFGQSWSNVPGLPASAGYFSFQYEFTDGTMWTPEGGGASVTQSAVIENDPPFNPTNAITTSLSASGGRFAMFFNPGVAFPQGDDTAGSIHLSGACQGDFGTQPACGLGAPVKILEGIVELRDILRLSVGSADLFPLETPNQNPHFEDWGTQLIAGSQSMDVSVQWQNTDYIVNDLIDTGMTFDADLTNGLLAPWETDVPQDMPSVSVAGREAFVGDDETWTAGTTGPVNDFACFRAPFSASDEYCDVQLRHDGTSLFQGRRIPEPAPLLLIGLGLGLMGLVGRRAKKA